MPIELTVSKTPTANILSTGTKSASDKAEITKLDPSEVMTTAQAAKLLEPLIKPLPSFDRVMRG
jgi:hypothetical protein